MEYILSMVFTTSEGKKSTMTINGVKDNLTKDQIFALMDDIIAKNVFMSSNGTLTGKDSAKVIERKVTSYEAA